MRHPWIDYANAAINRGLSVLRVIPPIRLSLWAEENFYLSSESSYVEGRWKPYPYQSFILDVFGHDDIVDVSVRKSARTGYTKMLLAASSYFTVVKHRNQCIWQPTDSDAQEFVETEYNPMLRDVRPIRPLFPALDKKSAHNKNDFKKFIGCVTYVKGGSSARNYRRISVDVTIQDEVDGFDRDIDQEGSSRKLAGKRTEGATFPKHIVGSTPKLKYLSEIDDAIAESDVVYTYRAPCPHCGTRQVLEFSYGDKKHGLQWVDNDPETAAYSCIDCGALFTQADYLSVWDQGRWEDEHGNWYDQSAGVFRDNANNTIRAPRSIGIDRLWAIYSPQTTWTQIVREWLNAKKKAERGDKSELKTVTNTTIGESYEDDAEKTDASELKKKAEDFPLKTVPVGALLLLAAVDVQKDRFELFVWGIGRGEEMWTVDYQVIEANPAIQTEWEKLDVPLQHCYRHAAGTLLHVEHAAIDTGGHWTHEAYMFIRRRSSSAGWTVRNPGVTSPRVYATKGSSTPGQKIAHKSSLQDVNHLNKLIKRGIRLYFIGTDSAKDLIHNRLNVEMPGPGYIHMSKSLPDAFFDQMTSEVRVKKRTFRGEMSVWVKRMAGIRNECLDLAVMTVFLMDKIGLHRKTAREWDLLESIVQPNQDDLFILQQGENKAAEVIDKGMLAATNPSRKTPPIGRNRNAGQKFRI